MKKPINLFIYTVFFAVVFLFLLVFVIAVTYWSWGYTWEQLSSTWLGGVFPHSMVFKICRQFTMRIYDWIDIDGSGIFAFVFLIIVMTCSRMILSEILRMYGGKYNAIAFVIDFIGVIGLQLFLSGLTFNIVCYLIIDANLNLSFLTVILLLSAVILPPIITGSLYCIIFNRDKTIIFGGSGMIASAISTMILFGLIVTFYTYAGFIPDTDCISSVSISVDGNYTVYNNPESISAVSDFDRRIISQTYPNDLVFNGDEVFVCHIVYHLKNGSELCRNYSLDHSLLGGRLLSEAEKIINLPEATAERCMLAYELTLNEPWNFIFEITYPINLNTFDGNPSPEDKQIISLTYSEFYEFYNNCYLLDIKDGLQRRIICLSKENILPESDNQTAIWLNATVSMDSFSCPLNVEAYRSITWLKQHCGLDSPFTWPVHNKIHAIKELKNI